MTGQQVKRLRDALTGAFTESKFEIFLLEELGKVLANLAPSSEPFTVRVFLVISEATNEDWAGDLIVAACRARPRNAALRDLAGELGLTRADDNAADPGRAARGGEPAGPQADRGGLERIILKSAGFEDAAVWHARMGALLRQVCRVEIPLADAGTATGTGFLVAPGLVLTNQHVVADLLAGRARPGDVRVRFDHARPPGDIVPSPGRLIGLAGDWLAASRPPSEVDLMAHPGSLLPGPDELDFAFLRLAESQPERGRARMARPGPGTPGLAAGDWLIILQYPAGAVLQQAAGQSRGLNGNKTRLRYTVNTDRGSSGAPVLNGRLELVGLHHAGDPNFHPLHEPEFNAAVPVPAILDYLDRAAPALARELTVA
jgi:hypothetical protein